MNTEDAAVAAPTALDAVWTAVIEQRGVIAIILGAVLVLLYAIRNFGLLPNQVPEVASEGETATTQALLPKARQLTVGRKYRRALVLYAASLLTLYSAIVFLGPQAFHMVFPAVDVLPVDDAVAFPVFVALVLAGVVSMVRPVRQIEEQIRGLFHRTAGIPAEFAGLASRMRRAVIAQQARDTLMNDTAVQHLMARFDVGPGGQDVAETWLRCRLFLRHLGAVAQLPIGPVMPSATSRLVQSCIVRMDEIEARLRDPGDREQESDESQVDWLDVARMLATIHEQLLAVEAMAVLSESAAENEVAASITVIGLEEVQREGPQPGQLQDLANGFFLAVVTFGLFTIIAMVVEGAVGSGGSFDQVPGSLDELVAMMVAACLPPIASICWFVRARRVLDGQGRYFVRDGDGPVSVMRAGRRTALLQSWFAAILAATVALFFSVSLIGDLPSYFRNIGQDDVVLVGMMAAPALALMTFLPALLDAAVIKSARGAMFELPFALICACALLAALANTGATLGGVQVLADRSVLDLLRQDGFQVLFVFASSGLWCGAFLFGFSRTDNKRAVQPPPSGMALQRD